MASHVAALAVLVTLSLGLGILGYAHFEKLGAADAFMNASMLLGGMGPVHTPTTEGGKLFAGLYALYCGLVFIVAIGIVLAPLLHRLMHHFHFSEKD